MSANVVSSSLTSNFLLGSRQAGKTQGFESCMRWFESSFPNQLYIAVVVYGKHNGLIIHRRSSNLTTATKDSVKCSFLSLTFLSFPLFLMLSAQEGRNLIFYGSVGNR